MSFAISPTRADRLHAMSIGLADTARRHAFAGDVARAMRHLALANALRHAASGDSLGRTLAMQEARALRKAMRKSGSAELRR